MKDTHMTNKLSYEISEETPVVQLTTYVDRERPSLNSEILVVAEVIKQRRRDASRIIELTIQATGALEKLTNSINTCL